MPETKSVQSSALISDDQIRDTVRRELDRCINVERRLTREQIAVESGINIHTIDAWKSRDPAKERPISLAQALSLASVLGDRAVNAIMALIGYSAARLDEADDFEPMLIAANAMGHLSVIARAASDGRIDHTEQPATTEAADLLIAEVLPLSSAGRK